MSIQMLRRLDRNITDIEGRADVIQFHPPATNPFKYAICCSRSLANLPREVVFLQSGIITLFCKRIDVISETGWITIPTTVKIGYGPSSEVDSPTIRYV
jgi:hypothetical protein